jgi:hypothetical protein
MDEETLALTVVETTMQEWLAAVTQIRQAPELLFASSAQQSHPPVLRPRLARPAARATQSAPAAIERYEAATTVGGARSIYWGGLALALAALAFL